MIRDPKLAHAFEATWPAAEYRDVGGFRIGRGYGGGGRISSARALADWQEDGIEKAVEIHREWQQAPLFRVDEGDSDLAAALARHGFSATRTTLIMEAPVASLTDLPLPPVTAFPAWPPLAVQNEIWAASGFSQGRLDAMHRVSLPRYAILGRINDRPAGSAFIVWDGEIAMLHALEVLPRFRRLGLGEWIVRQSAFMSAENDATRLALAVTAENEPAVALYRKLGFSEVARYAYWG